MRSTPRIEARSEINAARSASIAAAAQHAHESNPSADDRALHDLLRARLNEVPDSVVPKLQTLMYAGRDQFGGTAPDRENIETFIGQHRTFLKAGQSSDLMRQTIASKMPLATYLLLGVGVALAIGIELDGDWI